MRRRPKNLFPLLNYLTQKRLTMAYYLRNFNEIVRCELSDTEFSNFYYATEDTNFKDLSMLLAHLFKVEYALVCNIFRKIKTIQNFDLRSRIILSQIAILGTQELRTYAVLVGMQLLKFKNTSNP